MFSTYKLMIESHAKWLVRVLQKNSYRLKMKRDSWFLRWRHLFPVIGRQIRWFQNGMAEPQLIRVTALDSSVANGSPRSSPPDVIWWRSNSGIASQGTLRTAENSSFQSQDYGPLDRQTKHAWRFPIGGSSQRQTVQVFIRPSTFLHNVDLNHDY